MRQRGSIFIISLAVMAGLIAILVGAAATQRITVKAQINRMEQRQARLMAEAGISYAMSTLYDYAQSQALGTTVQGSATTLQDEWALLGSNGADRFRVGNGFFRIQIIDANAFVNLNSAPQEQLELLPLTPEQVDSLLDWREPSQTPRPLGAKDEYYNNLPNPYNAKLRRLDTFDELLLIKGFTPDVLFEPQDVTSTATIVQGSRDEQPTLYDLTSTTGYTAMTRSDGQAKINVNANRQTLAQRLTQVGIAGPLQQRILAQPNWPSIGQLLLGAGTNPNDYRLILNNLAVDNQPRKEGRINLNTATESVLNTIPNIQPDTAQAIVQRQTSGFFELGDIVDIPGLTTGQGLQQIADRVTVSSQTFVVRVIGESGPTQVILEAIVDIQEGRPKVIQTREAPFADMAIRWLWDEVTGETVLAEVQ